MGRYLVDCLSAKYDEDDEILVLFCLFKESGERKFVYMPRGDFCYRGNPVPHIEMHRTAQAFKGKPFWLEIHDDPNRNRCADENPIKVSQEFRRHIGNGFSKITEGLNDPIRSTLRNLDESSLKSLLEKEIEIRKQIGESTDVASSRD